MQYFFVYSSGMYCAKCAFFLKKIKQTVSLLAISPLYCIALFLMQIKYRNKGDFAGIVKFCFDILGDKVKRKKIIEIKKFVW